MRKTRDGFYVLEKFAQIPNLLHGFSSVDFGNMSFVHGEKNRVLANRARFACSLGLDPKSIISVRQDHGNNILLVTSASSIKQTEEIVADGLITNQKNVALLIKTADCLPILLFDPQKEVIGLIHAGWKGVVSKIHLKAIANLKDNFNCQPENIIVGIGPAICSGCYRGKIDLLEAVLADYQGLGLKKENIEMAEVCTFENKDFYSHQRSKILGEPEGRFATIYEIKKN